jgi:hypothetical protein
VTLLSVVATTAFADELIDIPTARKISFEDVRYEFRADPTLRGTSQSFLGVGIGNSYELDFRDIQNKGSAAVATYDFEYNLLAAIPGLAPGFSLGVQDAANLTSDGRRFYAVTTFRNTMDDIPGNVYADITLGFQVGSLTSPFVGVAVPFATNLFVLAEDSGFRVSAGLEYRPSKRMNVRLVVRNNQTLLSLSATTRF